MSAGPPDLSVIIVTYNTRDLTRACVRAVLADAEPSGQAVEVIVVDNASQDDTLTCLAAEFPAARLIANPANLGFARANNRGLEAAGGRYLFLLNSDTELRPGALGALVAFMDDHPEAGACGPQLLNPDGSLQPSGRPLPSVASVALEMTRLYRLWKRDLYRQPGRDYGQPARVGEISGAALLVRRAVLEQVGGLDPAFFAYYEDTDWCQRMGAAGFAVYYVPAAQVVHYWQGTSRAAAALARRAGLHSLRYYFAKHHGPAAQAAIQILLAGRELALWAGALLRRDPAARARHAALLSLVFAPLEAARP